MLKLRSSGLFDCLLFELLCRLLIGLYCALQAVRRKKYYEEKERFHMVRQCDTGSVLQRYRI